jgi:glycosyltransferase involved in cell wall biosynthesis
LIQALKAAGYAAMARPLIAADAPGSRDVVKDGVKGYLYRVRDAGSLAEAMRRLADLPSGKRLAMGEQARRTVQDRFSEEHVVSAYLDVIAGLEGRTAA